MQAYFSIDLFHDDVKRGKMKLTCNLIGSTFDWLEEIVKTLAMEN